MPDELMRLVYTSIHSGMNDEELQKLSLEARELGVRCGISGLLVVCDDDFFAILEGSPIAITTVLTNAVRDQRHHSLNVLLAETTNIRFFDSSKVIKLKELARSEKPLARKVKIAELNPRLVKEEQLEDTIMALAEAVQGLPS